MDTIGWFIATLHQLIGHDHAAAVIGQPPGNREDCLICQYEQHPDEESRQAVIAALRAPALADVPGDEDEPGHDGGEAPHGDAEGQPQGDAVP